MKNAQQIVLYFIVLSLVLAIENRYHLMDEML